MSASANGQGRLTATVSPRIQRILYGSPSRAELAGELRWTTTVDLAHVVMLTERELMSREAAARLLRHITLLRAEEFRTLHGAATPRGLYLAYEEHLIEAIGAGAGGMLHAGRSRNDLKATITALRLRAALADLVSELVDLVAITLSRARVYRDTVMPVHTHFQAALPVTYGYYLLGVALALGRDLEAVRRAAEGVRLSPLGAGAAAGSDLPIDPARTAALLGFEGPPVHALDAVASRDVALRALAAAAGATLTLSRLATDLQLWSTAEFGFVSFPDHLVGGSSAMPQKRNAFLLEHVKAKAGTAIGAWTAAATTMHATPFTNSIEVGTEAVAAVWPGLSAASDGVALAQALVAGASPEPERMLARARTGFVTATAVANRLVAQGMPFRAAHTLVGGAVRRAIERGRSELDERDLPPELDLAQPMEQVVARQTAGGGPGAFDEGFRAARRELVEHDAWRRELQERLDTARQELSDAVGQIIEPAGRARTR